MIKLTAGVVETFMQESMWARLKFDLHRSNRKGRPGLDGMICLPFEMNTVTIYCTSVLKTSLDQCIIF